MNATREQNSISRPSGGYPPMMEPASHLAAWQYVLPKREPVDHEERNDSGINSGSDCHSSSPGSDHSDNVLCSSPSISQMVRPILNYYSTPVMKMDQSSSMECHQYNNQPTHLYHNDHNLLSPPSSEPMASPNSLHGVTLSSSNAEVNREMNDQQTTLTPCASPDDEAASQTSSLPENNNDDPLKKLQMTFEKSSLLPSSPSPRHVEDSEEDKNKSVNAPTYYVQMVNSHGKVKKFKCKQCPFVCFVKADFWEHNKEHISIEKRLTCPKCPFVTEYKHHLEYHLRNHYGDKPYKCNQCSYDCVNKSMLNSHLKSHSKVYQYPCADCNYETKYCHSLKLHLRKYNHKPAMVRNPDGTPNPLPIIDVYGTRRGPKLKSQEQIPVEKRSPLPEAVPLPLNQFTPNLQFPFPAFPFFAGFPGALSNPLILQNLSQNLEKMIRENQSSSSAQEIQEETPQHMETGEEVLDLSKPEEPVQKSRRKGRAIKLAPEHNNLSDDEEIVTMFRNVEVAENAEPEASTSSAEGSSDHKEGESINNGENDYKCRYCNIYFGDSVLYTMHMGYHGYNNPFTCNMCGEVCADKISFFVHIARTSHS